eukprot:gene6689-10854_t
MTDSPFFGSIFQTIIQLIIQIFLTTTKLLYIIGDWFHDLIIGPRECYVEQFFKKKGYQFKVHRNITEDGIQIISYQIFPNVKNENSKKPVFLQHSFMINCIPFLFYENSLSMRFLKLGHEVWLGNTRGGDYGQDSHTRYDDNFWNYTMDDLLKFDLKCQIDTMLKVSNVNKFAYFGESQGGSQILALINFYPKYIDKIAFLGMISPGIYFKMPDSYVIRALFSIGPKFFGNGQFFRDSKQIQMILPAFLLKFFATLALDKIGFLHHTCSCDSSVFKSVPCGSVSVRHFAHWAQICSNEKGLSRFREELYEKNTNSNGISITDGMYSTDLLHKIPSIYFLSELDPVVDVKTIEKEFSEDCLVHVEEKYGHLDYLWSVEGCSLKNDSRLKYDSSGQFKKHHSWVLYAESDKDDLIQETILPFQTVQTSYASFTAQVKIDFVDGTSFELDHILDFKNGASKTYNCTLKGKITNVHYPLPQLPQQITFGIELELIASKDFNKQKIINFLSKRGVNINTGQQNSWRLVNDNSISCNISMPNCFTFEIVSPVLSGDSALDDVAFVIEQLE